MKVDPKGIVSALRRAVREGNRGMEDQLAEEITEGLKRLDAIEPRATGANPVAETGTEAMAEVIVDHGRVVVRPVAETGALGEPDGWLVEEWEDGEWTPLDIEMTEDGATDFVAEGCARLVYEESLKVRYVPLYRRAPEGKVPRCSDCEEPGKCAAMGCGAAAMLRAGLLPRGFNDSLLSRVADRLEALTDAVLRLQRERQWRPMSEAPMDGTYVLIATTSGMVLTMQFCSEGYWRSTVHGLPGIIPIAWMPKPPPPANLTPPT